MARPSPLPADPRTNEYTHIHVYPPIHTHPLLREIVDERLAHPVQRPVLRLCPTLPRRRRQRPHSAGRHAVLRPRKPERRRRCCPATTDAGTAAAAARGGKRGGEQEAACALHGPFPPRREGQEGRRHDKACVCVCVYVCVCVFVCLCFGSGRVDDARRSSIERWIDVYTYWYMTHPSSTRVRPRWLRGTGARPPRSDAKGRCTRHRRQRRRRRRRKEGERHS